MRPASTSLASESQDAAQPAHSRRAVRSFVVRAGRMTAAQQRAWRDLWPRLGVEGTDDESPLDFGPLFGRDAPLVLEVGFGNGESLVTLALAHPERNFVGIEVHRPGVGHLMLRCEAERVGNVRVLCDDAVVVLQRRVADATIDELLLYFPDPWPKKRHHKRRLLQPAFVALLVERMKRGAYLHVATDWQEYAEYVLAVLKNNPLLENTAMDYAPRPAYRPQTKFETRGLKLGHGVWDVIFKRR